MERNRWETAIRCLEVALHPHTSDDEVIAAVNGFRRTADGTPLREVCVGLTGGSHDARGLVGDPAGWREILDRLNRENLALQHRLDQAERGASDLSEELRASQRRADVAERQLADFRAAYTQVLDGLDHENAELRRALEQARRAATEPPAQRTAPPFQQFLAAARLRADQTESIRLWPTREASPESSGPSPRSPWTA